ncbi:hypothetical protein PQ478_21550 (plasmid) [Alkalihalophilus pseudofirmus]|uniref:DUF6615 family protein n=1 Tax=Alkalihalophilus pseudofirmus TaxID=79885 RepID=UPI00259BEA10|nr:DUF6615 family protein [Alkalihalophilus pseudofirmus]WEG19274.1 hypothetical protein PQ478_21550 [Alkalihalophilus pseudofirmus]
MDTCSIVKTYCLNYIVKRMDYIKNKGRYSEESITDEIIYQIKVNNPSDTMILHAPNESKTGADIEWWLLDRRTKKAIILRLQAKKLSSKGDYHGINRYVGSSTSRQIDRLISRSIKDRAIPLYCFYNFITPAASAKNSWTYSDAMKVKSAIPQKAPAHVKIPETNIKPMNNILDLICSNPSIKAISNNVIKPFIENEEKSNIIRYKRYSNKHHNRVLDLNDFIHEEKELDKVISAYSGQNNNYQIEAKHLLITSLSGDIYKPIVDNLKINKKGIEKG